jgi:hypothetical protein
MELVGPAAEEVDTPDGLRLEEPVAKVAEPDGEDPVDVGDSPEAEELMTEDPETTESVVEEPDDTELDSEETGADDEPERKLLGAEEPEIDETVIVTMLERDALVEEAVFPELGDVEVTGLDRLNDVESVTLEVEDAGRIDEVEDVPGIT